MMNKLARHFAAGTKKQVIFLLSFMVMLLPMAQVAYSQRTVDFSNQPEAGDVLVIGLRDMDELRKVAPFLSDQAVANLERAITSSGYKVNPGATDSFRGGAGEYGEIHLIGLPQDELQRRDWQDFGGRAAALTLGSQTKRVAIVAEGLSVEAAVLIGVGADLRQYSFLKYKNGAQGPVEGTFNVILQDAKAAQDRYQEREAHLADAVIWARDQQNEPANVLYPEEFVKRAKAAFRGVSNVSVKILDEKDMKRLNMNAILAVGQGSVRPPRLLVVEYKGADKNSRPVVFAGKGITFDTGGISLKKSSGMWRMKYDMSGASSVTGAVLSLAKSRAAVNAVAIAALAENMPDGAAQRPGDVIKTMSGLTVEVLNTDAEGRLVLSDALWYAQERFEPILLVDLATLTGAAVGALGVDYAALFARDDNIAARLHKAGEETGEDLWRLPLHPNHYVQIESTIADIKNADTGSPGASTAAALLGSFVKPDTPWAHLDIAGVGRRAKPTTVSPIGASGFGVMLLDQLARDYAAQK